MDFDLSHLSIIMIFCLVKLGMAIHTAKSEAATLNALTEKPVWLTQSSLSLVLGYEKAQILNVPGNIENSILKEAESQSYVEARPHIKISLPSIPSMEGVFRGRLYYKASNSTYLIGGVGPENKDHREKVDMSLNEAFLNFDMSEWSSVTLGRQNFQWGPAETFSPSNFVFHENVTERTAFFESKGKDMLRFNMTPIKSLSVIGMAEIHENRDDKPFGADHEFKPSQLIKVEKSWNGGAEYFGVSFHYGTLSVLHRDPDEVGLDKLKDQKRWSWGEYFSVILPFFEGGLSFYGDLSHQKGSQGWYPSILPNGSIGFDKKYLDVSQIKNISVLGLRYDFVDGEILRLEYVRDDHAYTNQEKKLAMLALLPRPDFSTAILGKNLNRYWNSGIDLKVQEIYYLSLSVLNVYDIRDFNLLVRSSWEPFQKSSWSFLSLETQVGDSGTASYSGMFTQGSGDGALRGTRSPVHMVAYRHQW